MDQDFDQIDEAYEAEAESGFYVTKGPRTDPVGTRSPQELDALAILVLVTVQVLVLDVRVPEFSRIDVLVPDVIKNKKSSSSDDGPILRSPGQHLKLEFSQVNYDLY